MFHNGADEYLAAWSIAGYRIFRGRGSTGANVELGGGYSHIPLRRLAISEHVRRAHRTWVGEVGVSRICWRFKIS